MKDDDNYNLPDNQPAQPQEDYSLGQEPAVNLMRQRLAGVYPSNPKTPPAGATNQPVPAPPSLNPADSAVHGQVDNERPARSVEDVKKQLLHSVRGATTKRQSRLKPFLFALAAGLVYLSISYNEVAIAQVKQYLSPGSQLTTPVIVDPTVNTKVGNDPRIIIPKINVDVPVVYDVKTYDEGAIQQALERGVVHYGHTALPGQNGNNVIVGHSSNNFFNTGRYKFAFVLLGRLEVGDTFILHYKGQRYIYKVTLKRIIEPNDFSLVQPTDVPTATLITCTPPGTSWQRLVIQGEQISPDPAQAEEASGQIVEDLEAVDTVVPGNAPSFWSNFFDLFN